MAQTVLESIDCFPGPDEENRVKAYGDQVQTTTIDKRRLEHTHRRQLEAMLARHTAEVTRLRALFASCVDPHMTLSQNRQFRSIDFLAPSMPEHDEVYRRIGVDVDICRCREHERIASALQRSTTAADLNDPRYSRHGVHPVLADVGLPAAGGHSAASAASAADGGATARVAAVDIGLFRQAMYDSEETYGYRNIADAKRSVDSRDDDDSKRILALSASSASSPSKSSATVGTGGAGASASSSYLSVDEIDDLYEESYDTLRRKQECELTDLRLYQILTIVGMLQDILKANQAPPRPPAPRYPQPLPPPPPPTQEPTMEDLLAGGLERGMVGPQSRSFRDPRRRPR